MPRRIPSHPVVVGLSVETVEGSPWCALPSPRLSWKTEVETPSWLQAEARLRLVRPDTGQTEEATIDGRASVLVDWPFAPLAPRERASISVRVRGEDGAPSQWSDAREFSGGFLGEGGWIARFVEHAQPERIAQPVLLRREFEIAGEVHRATLYATAFGAYQLEINGRPVDDHVLKPGWTSYRHRLVHESTDVTGLLRAGPNAIGADLAGGWFTESFGFGEAAARYYGEQPSLAAQLVIEYRDGRVEVVASDGSWKSTADGPIRESGIYAGETYDAGAANDGWSHPGLDDDGWSAVRVTASTLVPEARSSPPVRRIEEIAPVAVLRTPSGKLVFDFGQNLVGRVRLSVSGTPGETATLRYAEVLDGGELCVRPLRRASATDRLVLSGKGVDSWEPAFTFHGFRYVEVSGLSSEPAASDLLAIVLHSDMRRAGWFASSDPLLDRLHENVVWSMRGNFLSIPTDCPQRDERLGWTGDIQVFSPTATFLYDCDSFVTSWLTDLRLEQAERGGVVPLVVPDVLRWEAIPVAAWGDAATVVPWVLYERYGDLGILRAQYDSMRAWVELILAARGDALPWEGYFQFGDWLDPAAPADFPGEARTDPDLVAAAHLFRSTDLLARTASALAKSSDAERYRATADALRSVFLDVYVSPAGRMMSDTATAYAMAIAYGIVAEPGMRRAMGDRLAHLVRAAGYHISTGFVGTPIVLEALTVTGHIVAAGRLLMQTECPSWLYPVTAGATTVWERWDSLLEDGTVNPGEMTSFNHYALGAVADWLHGTVAGLGSAEPGYRTILIAPEPLAGLDFASARHETPYGTARSEWLRGDDGTISVLAVIPPNATALVRLPRSGETFEVGSGEHRWTVPAAPALLAAPPLTSASSLVRIVDDANAYRAVMEVVERHDPLLAREVRRHTRWAGERALIDDFSLIPPALADDIDSALASLSHRGSGRPGPRADR